VKVEQLVATAPELDGSVAIAAAILRLEIQRVSRSMFAAWRVDDSVLSIGPLMAFRRSGRLSVMVRTPPSCSTSR
jgi:hypothetical protein